MNPYMQKAKKAAINFMTKPWLQGWQWSIDVDTNDKPTDFDIYVKDIDFGCGSIDADTFQVGAGAIAYPTFSSAGEITMTVRDDQNLTINKWMASRISKVSNKDGTLNVPIDYVFNLSIFTLDDDGNKSLLKKYQVFAVKMGNLNFSREASNSIVSFPIVFQKFSTVGKKVF